eukprot:c14081_g1_i2.p1 GENE.c14081_g1_i2~~c14081_g1_i2.p1  ORF type:complete len:234 (-),score=49.67 c14081_g1_i2:1014-1715(-)
MGGCCSSSVSEPPTPRPQKALQTSFKIQSFEMTKQTHPQQPPSVVPAPVVEGEPQPKEDFVDMDSCEWLALRLKEVEWQVPDRTEVETEDLTAFQGRDETDPTTVYNFALKALWRNWIDSLEFALGVLKSKPIEEESRRNDVEYMSHKLEFTRIRQAMLLCCEAYRTTLNVDAFAKKSLELCERCDRLSTAQSDDMASALPGLIPRRDTMMLKSRIEDLCTTVQRLHKPQPEP